MDLMNRFMAKISPEPNSGCWLWDGSTNGRKGYGLFRMSDIGRNELSHRASWRLHHGPIPPGIKVLHKCDTPACVNPNHLFLGDDSENMRDAVRKGRHHNASVTECKYGHPFDEVNTRVSHRGRTCRACESRRGKIKNSNLRRTEHESQ